MVQIFEASDTHWIFEWALDDADDSDSFAMMDGVSERWKAIEVLAQGRSGLNYKQAVLRLTELAQGYALTSRGEEFDRELRGFVERHAKRGALLRRLSDAGLWPTKRLKNAPHR